MNQVSPTPKIIRHGMSFIADISPVDLQRLRDVVRRTVFPRLKPHQRTDREADRIIESYGPQVREDLIKQAVDNGVGNDYRKIFTR